MAEFDALPPRLRAWLAGARLPWSPRSVRRAFARAIEAAGGDVARAIAALDALEARALARDTGAVWGKGHPEAATGGAAEATGPAAGTRRAPRRSARDRHSPPHDRSPCPSTA